MQGLMGAMIEKNLQAFAELQAQMVENSKGLLQGGTLPHELWSNALTGQAPLVQSLMSSYLEQSRALLAKFPGMGGLAGHEQPRK
jgi:polyhydroxyalkanoate synthesis regulator protein